MSQTQSQSQPRTQSQTQTKTHRFPAFVMLTFFYTPFMTRLLVCKCGARLSPHDIDNAGSYELPGKDVTGLSVTGLSVISGFVHRLV